MTRLIYFSKVTDAIDRASLSQILLASRDNNVRNGLTGLLCYNLNYFIQVLEGDRDKVNQTFSRISSDPRHQDPEIVVVGPVQKRAFTHWWMAYADEPDIVAASLRKYTGDSVLRPDLMRPETILAFLEDVWRTTLVRSQQPNRDPGGQVVLV